MGILSIMLAGYPPFENASATDIWFKPMTKEKVDKFWRAHQKSAIAKMPAAKDLISKMLCADPTKRINIDGIVNHEWFKGTTLSAKQLKKAMRQKHANAHMRKSNDKKKMKELVHSFDVKSKVHM